MHFLDLGHCHKITTLHVAPLVAFKALFSNTKADLSTACSECCRWDLNNTAVGTKKEPLEMAR